MWNFNYAIPSLLILCIFLGYFFALPRIPVRMNRIFIRLVGVEFLVMVADIVSTWACINYEMFSAFVLYVLNEIYFVLFFARAYNFFLFTACVLRSSWGLDHKKRMISHIPLALLTLIVLSSPWTKLFFYIDDTGYHSGKLYNLLYVLFAYFLLMSFILVMRYKTNVRRKREFNSVFWYNLILSAGLVFRYIFPKYLLMDTFCIMALTVIYLSFENPDFYLEPRTWIFNSRGLRDYIEEINNEKKYTIFEFVIHNYKDLRELYGSRQMDQGTSLIGDYLRGVFRTEKIFYYRNGRFIILGDYDFDNEKAFAIIKDRFKMPWKSDDAELYLDIGAAAVRFGDQNIRTESVMTIISESFEMAEQENEKVYVIGDEIIGLTAKQADVKRALKYAIDHDRVKVFLQPIVNSKTGKVEGAEALTRIVDEKDKLVPPSLFIPIAEKNGMINRLGEKVFEQTCKLIKEQNVRAMGLSWINVNLSPVQFLRSDISEKLYGYVKKYDVDPGFIHLEITEEAMVDETLLTKQMEDVISKGFFFVLDDYGKGYSNAIRLKKCSFINIKLDMSIVWEHCKQPDGLLPNMVSTFGSLGFKITAEGIEDENMVKIMTDIGVDYLQGYYFSKPLPIEEFKERYGKS